MTAMMLHFLRLLTYATMLQLVLKNRVSMVRFRPRPPDKKSPLCLRSGLFLRHPVSWVGRVRQEFGGGA